MGNNGNRNVRNRNKNRHGNDMMNGGIERNATDKGGVGIRI